MIIHNRRTETITVNMADTESIHKYYMYLVCLEKEGYPVITEVVNTSSSFDGAASITFKIETLKYRS